MTQRFAAMAATLTDERFDDPDWIFERKLDGIRCLAYRDGGGVELLSRNDLSLNGRFPEVAEALGRQAAARFVVDGEVVAFAGSRTSFARLADRRHGHVRVYYYVFDVLWVDGRDVRERPLMARKGLLRRAIGSGGSIRMTPYRVGTGQELFEEACRRGWEGLIAKRLGTPYVSTRSRDWLKLKCTRAQELVIGGFTAPRGSRTDLGALLVGHFEGDRLRYAGKVGTGFTRATLRELSERLAPLVRETSPFEPEKGIPRAATWVEPEVVAQIAFMEWTPDGRLRHPSFLGVRFDKPAREVVREEP